MDKITWYLPIKTVSEGNSSEHWRAKSKRHRQQQFFIKALFNSWEDDITLPCIVRLIRLAPRRLDEDNNVFAFKWVRDQVSECLVPEKAKSYVAKNGKVIPIKGRADSDDRITWVYDQEKSPTLGIRIEIEADPSTLSESICRHQANGCG